MNIWCAISRARRRRAADASACCVLRRGTLRKLPLLRASRARNRAALPLQRAATGASERRRLCSCAWPRAGRRYRYHSAGAFAFRAYVSNARAVPACASRVPVLYGGNGGRLAARWRWR